MILDDLLTRMTNGAVRIVLYNYETGEILFKTIWHNMIPHEYYNFEVDSIDVRDYEMRLGIHD